MRKFLFIATCLFTITVSAKTIQVGANRNYKNITTGIAAAAPGDTVLVDAGLYREKKLIIRKYIILKGIGYPTLDGENKFEIIAIKANGVVVEGFRVMHSGISSLEDISGIKVYDCNHVTIKNNILEDTFFGIYIQNGVNCTIENNQLTSYGGEEQQNANGIHCWKCDSMRIIGNKISGHRDGIYFEFVKNSIIWRNTSYKNIRYGLHFMFSNEDMYVGNIFSNRTFK